MQELLYDYLRGHTARVNAGDNPEQCQKNMDEAFKLLKIISDIGNGICLFPPREKKREEEEAGIEEKIAKEEKTDRTKTRKDFHYHYIRECEVLRDDEDDLVLPMQLMRSLASLHLRFNNLHVERAMNTNSIALAKHTGEELLTLVRNELDPPECVPLQTLSEELRSRGEPVAKDFKGYPAMLAELSDVPKLILTLLHKDIARARPVESEDELYGREDLVGQYRTSGDIVTNTIRAVIMRELIEYLADYAEALRESEKGKKNERFTVRNAFRVYKLLRENARKYLFQSALDLLYLTGGDHGAKHLIQGDVRFGVDVARQLPSWTARDRIYLRQIAADHDLGYTHAALQLFSTHENGIPLANGYYNLLKDHPLYSSAYFEVHRPEYEEHFGKEGAGIIDLSILDHSKVKGNLRDPDHAKRIQALFCRIDCMAVSADLKAAPAFMRGRVLIAMSKGMEAAEYLKDVDGRLENLWKEDKVGTDEYRWLLAVQESLRIVAGDVKRYLLSLSKEIYRDRVQQEAYTRAVELHFDKFNPQFPVQRDFGSNAIEFAGITARCGEDRDYLTVQLGIRDLFFAVTEYFGEEQGPRFAMSAIKKVFEDFGGVIHDPAKVVNAFAELSHLHGETIPEKDVENHAHGGMEYPQRHATHVYFSYKMLPRDKGSMLVEHLEKQKLSLKMMGELLQLDFDTEELRLLLVKIAKFTPKMPARIRQETVESATKLFISQHFTLPK